MKRLARQCTNCQTLMVVMVADQSVLHIRYLEPDRLGRDRVGYNSIDCIEGCHLPKKHRSCGTYEAFTVKCTKCKRLRYLSKFEEVKV